MSAAPKPEAGPLPVVSAALVSLAVSGLSLLARPWGIPHGMGLGLGFVALLAAVLAWRTGAASYRAVAMIALSLQVGVFLLSVAGTPPLAPVRLIQAGAILAYVGVLVSVLLVRVIGIPSGRAQLFALAGAVAALGIDTMLGIGPPPSRVPERRDWPDSADAHPSLGRVPRPYVDFKVYYPDNPQGYLEADDSRAKTWEFQVMPGSVADLLLPSGNPGFMRVDIRKANPDTTWHVQLFHSRFATQRRRPYVVTFRARADRPRKASFGFAQHHPPWRSLGLYQEIQLTPEWQAFREVFMARATDSNTMILFHLAGSSIPVEIDSVRLQDVTAGRDLAPALPAPVFYVRHQRNALGCRDRDYDVPRTGHAVRILALGDAFTTGQGVHEKDTFASSLEQELNTRPGERDPKEYEVINCGVSGYGTREQLLFYELFGMKYRPDLVLVTMGWNDARFYWEQQVRASIRRGPGRLLGLSSVVRKIVASLRLRESHDYRRSVEDLLALDKAVRLQGARLVVAVSRHGPPGLGDQLLAAVQKGLEGTSIPILDLGTLETANSARDLRSPPGPRAHQAAATELLQWLRKDILPNPANRPTSP